VQSEKPIHIALNRSEPSSCAKMGMPARMLAVRVGQLFLCHHFLLLFSLACRYISPSHAAAPHPFWHATRAFNWLRVNVLAPVHTRLLGWLLTPREKRHEEEKADVKEGSSSDMRTVLANLLPPITTSWPVPTAATPREQLPEVASCTIAPTLIRPHTLSHALTRSHTLSHALFAQLPHHRDMVTWYYASGLCCCVAHAHLPCSIGHLCAESARVRQSASCAPLPPHVRG
jgi:hypothetical protein